MTTRQALANHASNGTDEELVASWVACRKLLAEPGSPNVAVLTTALGAVETELLRRGMSPEQSEQLDWAVTTASQAKES